MTQANLNRFNMWETVYAVLQTNKTVWQGNTKFSAKVEQLKALIDVVKIAAQAQTNTSTGITEDKDSLAEKAIAMTSYVAKVVKAIAIDTKDRTLLAAVDFSKSTLQNTPDDELAALLKGILVASAGMISTTLSEYGMNPSEVANAQAAVAAFEAQKSAPREAIVAHKTTTNSIPKMMKDGKLVLVVLDNLVHLYDDTDPVFVGNYKNARVVVDAGSRHNPPPPPPTH